MNCKSAQQGILLSHTGELPAGEERNLAEHLVECPNCRKYRTDAVRVSDLVRKALPSTGPSHLARENILSAGTRELARGSSTFLAFPAMRWLAVAAGFLLLVAGSGLLLVAHERRDAAEHGRRISQMSTIVAMMAGDETMVAEALPNDDALPDMRALARQIMQMEDMVAEDPAEDEETIPDDDAQPRDLQSHSTSGFRPAECV